MNEPNQQSSILLCLHIWIHRKMKFSMVQEYDTSSLYPMQ